MQVCNGDFGSQPHRHVHTALVATHKVSFKNDLCDSHDQNKVQEVSFELVYTLSAVILSRSPLCNLKVVI